MGGDLPTTKKSSVGTLQLVGVGLAQWLPGLIQACLLPYAAQPGMTRSGAWWGATVSLAAAGVLCLVTFIILQLTLRLSVDSVAAAVTEEGGKTIGVVCCSQRGRVWLWYDRIVVLAPMAVLLFSAEATYTFLIVLSPHLPIAPTGAVAFMQTYQVTLLLMCANTFAFFGRSIGLKASASQGIDTRVLVWWSLTPLAVVLALLYWRSCLPLHPGFPITLYSLTALINGFTLVLLSKSSQAGLTSARTGRHSYDWNPCPIAAQLVWFSLQTGAFVPALAGNWLK